MTNILVLLALKSLIVCILSITVKMQLTIHRGYDLTLASSVLLAAELFVALSNMGFSIYLNLIITVTVNIAFMMVWNYLIHSCYKRYASFNGEFVFLISIGVLSVMVALIGLVRGPGLVYFTKKVFPFLFSDILFALIICFAACIYFFGIIGRQIGFMFTLCGQNSSFAKIVGVDIQQVSCWAGVNAGFLAAIAGISLALLGGSNLYLGSLAFLLGIGGALIFNSAQIKFAALGGLLLGFLWVFFEYTFSPVTAQPLVYVVISLVIISRAYIQRWDELV